MEAQMNKTLTDLLFKVLSVLVIPLILWGVKLEVDMAVKSEKIEQLERDIAAASAVKVAVATNSTTLARMEEKIDGTNKRLDEIRDDLRRPLPR
jgi:hypothetical protein